MAEPKIMQEGGDWANATQPGTYPKINSIFDFSAEALGQIKLWLEQQGLNLPVSNIIGFSQFTAQVATPVATGQTRTSSTYGDLSTSGPSLSDLPAGGYLFFFGCAAAGNPGTSNAHMSIQVNSTTAVDDDSCLTSVGSSTSIMTVVAKSLTIDNNTVTAKYKSSDNASVCTFSKRWLIALRYANK